MEIDTLIIHFLHGPLLLILGYVFASFPPKEINSLYGYRTSRSMKNDETWKYANKISAHYLIRVGLLITLIQLILILFLPDNANDTRILMLILLLPLAALIFFTEKKLKEEFDRNGNKKI